MTPSSHTDLREELTALADTQPFSPDPAAWNRGRRARRHSRLARVGAVVAVVALVAGVGGLAARPDTVAPADDVRGGALPSRVPEPDGPVLTDLASGAASVAYVDTNGMPVLVDATTGQAHWVELPDFPSPEVFEATADFRRGSWLAVSPDGRRIAYPTTAVMEREPGQTTFQTTWFRIVDLTTGTSDLVDTPPYGGTPLAMSWTVDGRIAIDAYDKGRINRPVPDVISWVIDPTTGASSRNLPVGLASPDDTLSATYPEPDALSSTVPFTTADDTETAIALPTDLYPDGAVVQPIGWVEADVLVASVDPPPSDVVERPRLALITSPDRPGSQAIFREFLPRLPPTLGLSIAVDLVPDLTDDPDQELTHDFSAGQSGDPAWTRWVYGAAGVLAVLSGLVLLAAMGRRRA